MSDEEMEGRAVYIENVQVGDNNQIKYCPNYGCSLHTNNCVICSVSIVRFNINNVQDDMVVDRVENRDNQTQLIRSLSQLSNGVVGLYSRFDNTDRRIDMLKRELNENVNMVTVSPRSDDNAAERMVTSNTQSADNTAVKSVALSARSADNAERMFNSNTLSAINAAERKGTRMIDQMDDRLTNAEELARLNSGDDANRMTNIEIRPLDEGARMSDAVSGRLDAIDFGIWQINARLDNVTDHVKLLSQTVAAMSVDYEYPNIKIKRSKWKRFKQLFRRKSKKNNVNFPEDHSENHIYTNVVHDDIYVNFPEDHTENHIDNNLVDDDIYVNFPEDHTGNSIDNNLVDDNVNAIDSEDHTGNLIDNNLVDDDVYAIDSEDHTENNGASIGCSTTNSERPVIEERYSTLSSHGIGNNDDSYLEINNTSDENGGYINSKRNTVIRPLPDLPPPIASTVENSHHLYDKPTRFPSIHSYSDVLY